MRVSACRDGQAQWSAEVLQQLALESFDVLMEDSMPLLIAEHSRKFELLMMHRLVIRKK